MFVDYYLASLKVDIVVWSFYWDCAVCHSNISVQRRWGHTSDWGWLIWVWLIHAGCAGSEDWHFTGLLQNFMNRRGAISAFLSVTVIVWARFMGLCRCIKVCWGYPQDKSSIFAPSSQGQKHPSIALCGWWASQVKMVFCNILGVVMCIIHIWTIRHTLCTYN